MKPWQWGALAVAALGALWFIFRGGTATAVPASTNNPSATDPSAPPSTQTNPSAAPALTPNAFAAILAHFSGATVNTGTGPVIKLPPPSAGSTVRTTFTVAVPSTPTPASAVNPSASGNAFANGEIAGPSIINPVGGGIVHPI